AVVRQFCLNDSATYYPGYYGTEQLLATGATVDCIFYQNDTMAFGGLQYCQKIGLDIPNDIGVAGWGDMPIASVLDRRMTSVHVSHLKLGKVAAEMMVARISGEPVETAKDIGFRLVPGATVRRLDACL
ncbi:MAG: substrate-binding domain-containing protein, partial [Pseudomonadota bacterium]